MAPSESRPKNDYSDRVALYDVEYQDDSDLPLLDKLIGDAKNVLELPCGSGVRALHFAKMGKQVTAIDLEPGMIDLLSSKLTKLPELNVKPIVGDMRHFSLAEKFDRIFIIREAFQFLTDSQDILSCLNCLASHMDADGRLIIDLVDFNHNSNGRLAYWDAKLGDGIWRIDWTRDVAKGCTLQRKHNQKRGPDSLIQVKLLYHLQDTRSPDNNQEWNADVVYRNFQFEEFRDFCDQSGLTIDAVYGDYDFREYTFGDPRLIFVLKAQK